MHELCSCGYELSLKLLKFILSSPSHYHLPFYLCKLNMICSPPGRIFPSCVGLVCIVFKYAMAYPGWNKITGIELLTTSLWVCFRRTYFRSLSFFIIVQKTRVITRTQWNRIPKELSLISLMENYADAFIINNDVPTTQVPPSTPTFSFLISIHKEVWPLP